MPPLPERGSRPRFDIATACALTGITVLMVVLGEINRLSGAVLDDRARTWPFTDLMGPSRLLDHSPDGWRSVAQALAQDGRLQGWLVGYLLLDLVLIVLYVTLLGRLLHPSLPSAYRIVLVAAAVDLTENGLALVVALGTDHVPLAAEVLPWVSGAKWLGLLLASVVVLRRLFRRGDPSWRRAVARVLRALYTHRFSVVALLPLLTMSILPGPDMLDQLPDIQRRWTDDPTGLAHGVAASVALAVLGVVVLVLGRMRSDFTWWRVHGWPEDGDRPQPLVWFWLICAGAVLAIAVLLPAVTGTDGRSWPRVLVFAGVPAVIGAASLLLRSWLSGPPTGPVTRWVHRQVRRPDARVLRPEHVRPVRAVGDILAVLVPVVGGLGLVRSFAAPIVLDGGSAWSWVLLMLGAGVALAAWPVGDAVLERLEPTQHVPRTRSQRVWGRLTSILSPGHPTTRRQTTVAAALLAGSTLGLLVVGSLPAQLGAGVGVIACVVLALTLLTTLVAGAVVLLQYGGSPHVFWLPGIRLSVAPVVTLLVVTLLVAGTVGGSSDVHGVRSADARERPLPARADLRTAFEAWLADPGACRHTVTAGGREVTLRPMLLVAAEGGGVRGAYWTAAGLDVLSGRQMTSDGGSWLAPATGDGACGARSTLLSGGASGGAVGLATTRFAPVGGAREEVVRITGADALGSGVVGLFVRDLVYSAAGVPLPVAGAGSRWVDRAGLMERSWEHNTTALAHLFLPDETPPVAGSASGHLVLTSTSATTGCRMLVSQLELADPELPDDVAENAAPGRTLGLGGTADGDAAAEGPSAPADGSCDALDRPAPRSVDLLADYAAAEPGCLGELSTATASMLTARFPYVTPSGVIGPCGEWPVQQLVDGGYTENTGLGTLVDLAPQWLVLVQEHNRAALAGSEDAIELVVPLVVYLDNGTGSDLAAPRNNLTNELLVPPVANSRAAKSQSDTGALLQRVAALTGPWRLGLGATIGPDVPHPEIVEAIEQWRPHSVVVVNQTTFPSVTAPLGWVLSQDSMDTLDEAMQRQVESRCDPATTRDVLCARGFGTLGDALAVLGAGS
ncbi:hypothetical protein GCM10009583_05790 [Ornithinicoccus hortensis]